MPKENKTTSQLAAKLQQARALLDECIEIAGAAPSRKPKSKPGSSAKTHIPTSFDFTANERAFMRSHARQLSGPKKFPLVLAYLAKGDVKREIQLKDIERLWNRMTAILGDFNRKYSNDAKERGWVNTTKQGSYVLRHSWQEILK